ncbi:metal transporter CNNM, partial [Tremellales sp. Uapishka_1]
MPPLRRSAKAALPTLLSITKLFQLVPQLFSNTVASSPGLMKRGGAWGTSAVQMLAEAPEGPEDPPGSPQFIFKLVISAGLVLAGGVFAGLTLALMGSDDLNLRVLSASSADPAEKKSAAKVLRLLDRGRHWVLVVLLLGNVIVNESLPIFLDDVLGGGVRAVIASTTMIVIFGEIIPQAVCVRYGLAIGGVCAPMVLCLMILFAPIAYPIAKLLDYVLGKDEGHTYKKAELKSFLQFHREGEEPLRDDEIVILNGVLSLNDRHAKDIMTPIKDCLTIPADKVLDHEAIDHILLSGFSRIPVYEPGQKDNFIGMLLVKRLITYNPEDNWPVSKFSLLPLPEARPNINCFQALDYFQTGRAHLLLISETPGQKGGAIGIVSLEDLIEEIIGEEIVDETDRYQDNHSKKAAKRSGTAAVMRGIIERQKVVNAFSRRPSFRPATPQSGLPPPNGTNDGLLIQIDNGHIVAEAVGLPAHGEGNGEEHGQGNGNGNGNELALTLTRTHSNPSKGETAMKDISEEPNMKDISEEGDLLVHIDHDAMTFATHRDFEDACKRLVGKYAGSDGARGLGPERTNAGWTWKEHPDAIGHGYLTRTSTRPGNAGSSDSDGTEEEEMEEDDVAVVGPGRKDGSIKVEHDIVYSRTYHIPMLCLRAFDSSGAPLALSALLSTGILRASQLPSSASDRPDALMLDAQSPFPLIQQCEHPETGDIVWSIHPCQVGLAVDEILIAEPDAAGSEAKGVRWLESWLMLSNSIVDLELDG